MQLRRFFVITSVVIFTAASANRAETPSASKPAGERIAARSVSFTTDDNLVIHAGYVPSERGGEKSPIVILLHMYRSDRGAFAPLVPHLHAAGFSVLALDLRGHGQSLNAPEMRLAERVAQRDRKLFEAMDKDVAAAYLWLVEQPGVDPARFALVGASVGASIALDYAAHDKSVDAVVCLTPGTSYLGLDSAAAIEKYARRPLLLVAAETERSAAEQLGHLAPAAKVRICSYSGSDPQGLHGTRMLARVPGIEKEVTEFLSKAVGPPTREVVVASMKGQVYYAPEASMASHLSKRNVRWFSSPGEAEQRGLHAPRSGSRRGTSRAPRAGKPAPEGDAFPDTPSQ